MTEKRIIDISMTLQEPMRGFSRKVAREMERDGWNASTLEIYSHAGTHMDAPLHFEVNNGSIDQVPVQRLVCDCHVLKVLPCERSRLITVNDLSGLFERIRPGEGLIIRTDWSKWKDNPEIYRDQLPRIGEDFARWMSDHKINLVGVEPPSVADVNNLEELQRIHRILLEGDILILEGLCNLDQITADKVQLVALPLKIGGGDGAPVRAIVIQ